MLFRSVSQSRYGGFVSHGKCLLPESEVFDWELAKFISFDDLYRNDYLPKVVTYNEETRCSEVRKFSKIWRGEKRRKVTFKVGGIEQRVGHTHPFLTPDGWKPAGDLRNGDLVATVRRIRWTGSELDLREAELLGFSLGDGSYVDCTPKIISFTKEGCERIEELLKDLGYPYSHKVYKQGKEHVFRLLQKPKFLEDLSGKKAWEKEIPSRWMKSGEETIKAILRGLWQTES